MMKKLSIAGFATVATALGLVIAILLSVAKAIEDSHDDDYFWE